MKRNLTRFSGGGGGSSRSTSREIRLPPADSLRKNVRTWSSTSVKLTGKVRPSKVMCWPSNLPNLTQVFPSPAKPSWQTHWKLPTVLMQSALAWQSWSPVKHSFTSGNENHNWSLNYTLNCVCYPLLETGKNKENIYVGIHAGIGNYRA